MLCSWSCQKNVILISACTMYMYSNYHIQFFTVHERRQSWSLLYTVLVLSWAHLHMSSSYIIAHSYRLEIFYKDDRNWCRCIQVYMYYKSFLLFFLLTFFFSLTGWKSFCFRFVNESTILLICQLSVDNKYTWWTLSIVL